MTLGFLEVSGFRGFRDKIRVDFGSRFTVISGRNGVGKSTLCDAIEYALTGSINKYAVQSSAMESVRDYLWWRGGGQADEYYVTLGFVKENGKHFIVTRTRDAGLECDHRELEDALCSGPRPADPIHQLCTTTIIRDEWIAALSVDLSEVERFKLVRSALGPLEGSELGKKATQIVNAAKEARDKREDAYNLARNELSNYLDQLSELRTTVSRASDIEAAMRVVRATIADAPSDIAGQLAAGRAALGVRRSRLGRMQEAILETREVLGLRQAFDMPEERERRTAVRLAMEQRAAEKSEAADAVTGAENELKKEQEADTVYSALALLVHHGESLGLHDARCPLCGAARTVQEFEDGVEQARGRIKSAASRVTIAQDELVAARGTLDRVSAEYTAAKEEWTAIKNREASLLAREEAHVELFGEVGLDFRLIQDVEALENEVGAERERLINLENAMTTLEASQMVSRTTSLEERVAKLREDVERAAKQAERSQGVVAAATAMERAVTRVSAEIIEERLSDIRPLLNELYQRLRPHADWRTIDYSVRGDVRRFLSLRVGKRLNPQFVLSSGQRRAVGLAFLLSVHLSRAWTTWRSLVLDDPIQHIDDFRALQFIEILAAFQLEGRQIVCTVEDSALADLLCRRLASNEEGGGRRYDIDLGDEGPAVVMTETPIHAATTAVRRSEK